MTISLRKAALLLLGASFLLALVPAGWALDRRLEGDLEARDREDLARAPIILRDRNARNAEMMSMHAQAIAGAEGLSEALMARRYRAATQIVMEASTFPGEDPVLTAPDGTLLVGPEGLEDAALANPGATDSVAWVTATDAPRALALADVMEGVDPVGLAGVSAALNEAEAMALAGLTRSDVVVISGSGVLKASSLEPEVAEELAKELAALPGGDTVAEIRTADDTRYWAVVAPLGRAGSVGFVRSVADEMAVLPQLRRTALLAGVLALGLALLGASVVARILARPVEGLALAADRVRQGDFGTEVSRSTFAEVNRVSGAFDEMRRALADRVRDLEDANHALEDRQRRLEALQTELVQRDRLAANSRLVAELAHEIRNPVANVRNCLEVVRRSQEEHGTSTEFTDLAIHELLRMHELAERMLDTNRPDTRGSAYCDAAKVITQVAQLYRVGSRDSPWSVSIDVAPAASVTMPPDALKQVLMNLVENAREAMPEGGEVRVAARRDNERVQITVDDQGSGIAPDVLPRVFDPFYTTKGAVTGVGLGLFVAQGVVRRYGGRISAENRVEGGARFTVELPAGPEGSA